MFADLISDNQAIHDKESWVVIESPLSKAPVVKKSRLFNT